MVSSKEDFLDQLQFKIGHRWPELNPHAITTITDLTAFIEEKNKLSAWKFLRFLPVYEGLKSFLKADCGVDATINYNLNNLPKADKKKFVQFLEENFGKPLVFKRPEIIQNVVFLLPIALILFPLLISTYLVAGKDVSGWVYLSGLFGLGLTFAAFQLTAPLKSIFSPAELLSYSKSFYVVNNQNLTSNPSSEMLTSFLCEAASHHFKQDFSAESRIPE